MRSHESPRVLMDAFEIRSLHESFIRSVSSSSSLVYRLACRLFKLAREKDIKKQQRKAATGVGGGGGGRGLRAPGITFNDTPAKL